MAPHRPLLLHSGRHPPLLSLCLLQGRAGVREGRHLQAGETSERRFKGSRLVYLLLVMFVCKVVSSVSSHRVSYLYQNFTSTQTFVRLNHSMDYRLDLLEAVLVSLLC